MIFLLFTPYLSPVLNVIVFIVLIVMITIHISVHTSSPAIKVKLSFMKRSLFLLILCFTFVFTDLIRIMTGL